MDLDTLYTQFEREYLALHSVSEPRRRAQLSQLRRLAASLDKPFVEITAADVNAFIGAALADGKHPNTGRFYAGLFRPFLDWGASAGVLPAGQSQLVRNPRGSRAQNAPRPYKPAEIAELRRAIALRYPTAPHRGKGSREMGFFTSGKVPHLRRRVWQHAKRLQLDAQVSLALELGLRRTEIVNLPLDALHPDNVHVSVRSAKQGPHGEVRRSVPYTSHARSSVQDWLDFRYLIGVTEPYPWLMLQRSSQRELQTRPLTLDAFARALHRCGDWEWHRLRHTCATEWLRAGIPLEKVRVMMGHSSLEQTTAYTEINDDDIEQAVYDAEERFTARLGLGAAA